LKVSNESGLISILSEKMFRPGVGESPASAGGGPTGDPASEQSPGGGEFESFE